MRYAKTASIIAIATTAGAIGFLAGREWGSDRRYGEGLSDGRIEAALSRPLPTTEYIGEGLRAELYFSEPFTRTYGRETLDVVTEAHLTEMLADMDNPDLFDAYELVNAMCSYIKATTDDERLLEWYRQFEAEP